MHNLTPIEQRVLKELLRGHSQKEIASQLGLTVRTVRFHLDRLRHFYGARSLPQLAALVVSRHLIDAGDSLKPDQPHQVTPVLTPGSGATNSGP